MKKTLFTVAIISIIMSSCKNEKNEKQAIEHESKEIVKTEDNIQILNNNWINEIQLDNGNKWTANKETNIGVQEMKDILNSHKTNTLDEYHNLAKELTHSKNYVVKECTMNGPSHDNLHVWLLPLMEKLDALLESETKEEASEIKQIIIENVNEYNTYFK